jgi:Mg-chelatase subunit ChlD
VGTAIVKGSISDVAQAQSKSIAQSFIGVKILAIVDVSSSMEKRDGREGETRYEVAVDELAKLQDRNPGDVAVIAFSDDVEFCPGGIPVFLRGTTNLAGALRFAKIADAPGIRFVIISDGQPNNRVAALNVASTIKARIDTIYVSAPGGRGSDFLKELSSRAGGKNATIGTHQLYDTVTRLTLSNG